MAQSQQYWKWITPPSPHGYCFYGFIVSGKTILHNTFPHLQPTNCHGHGTMSQGGQGGVFHEMSSSVKGCLLSKGVLHQRLSLIKCFFFLHPYACVMLRTFFPSRHSLFLVNAADCISVHAIPGSDRPSKIVPLTLSRTGGGGVNLTRPFFYVYYGLTA